MKRLFLLLISIWPLAVMSQNYRPDGRAFVCENGTNRYTRALYGGPTDYRVETSDHPVFAVTKKGLHRNVRFRVGGVALDSTDYCVARYEEGRRDYVLADRRWGADTLRVSVVALHDREAAVWRLSSSAPAFVLETLITPTRQPKLNRNGDIGVDSRDAFDAHPDSLTHRDTTVAASVAYVCIRQGSFFPCDDAEAARWYAEAVDYNRRLTSRLVFDTPDPWMNTLGGALAVAADGDWDGQTWLHGCVGWRMPLAGWRAAYVGDVLGWGDRQRSHFDAYARSQVTAVPPTIPHPSMDTTLNLARAEKRWGTQMYSDGYICRNPGRNDQMHHYDMNLNYIDELLWHFQYDADTLMMRRLWPVIVRHLAWEKRNFDPDGDHLYDAYCCIWASDALYYNGGAVTHSSAYNYRANRLAARIAEFIGEDSKRYNDEADAIFQAMNSRLWMPGKGVWAEYQDAMGLRRLHESPAVWSVYTPIDCGASTPRQAWLATQYVNTAIPHIPVADTGLQTIATSDWMPYSWSINNVAAAEVMHTALAFFEAGRADDGYRLLKANVMDQMYYGASPGNFGQVSQYDAARGECYRDFGDCIGISSRTLVQGLFGIIPDALNGQCVVRPGLPSTWSHASVTTPYLSYRYEQRGDSDVFVVSQHFPQRLRIVFRQNLGGGEYRDYPGTDADEQVFVVRRIVPLPLRENRGRSVAQDGFSLPLREGRGGSLSIPIPFNANVTDLFHQRYLSPRPAVTTLQIPVQGIGDWCHPTKTAEVDDSVFRALAVGNRFVVAGVPFRTPQVGKNILYTSLWDNYPDSVVIPLKGQASSACLLMAGTTNHMQSRIDNALVVVAYRDGTADTLRLRNPDNWCPIEQDYYVDQLAFRTSEPRPWRIGLSTGIVSRHLGDELGLRGADNRVIPGGAAQMLRMPLNRRKRLRSLTLRVLSNDVVVGLMGVTLER